MLIIQDAILTKGWLWYHFWNFTVKCAKYEMAVKHICLQSWKSYNSVNTIISWLHYLDYTGHLIPIFKYMEINCYDGNVSESMQGVLSSKYLCSWLNRSLQSHSMVIDAKHKMFNFNKWKFNK